MSSEDWKDKITRMLANEFENDPETFSRVMYFLDEEEKTYKNCSSPLWRTLKCSLHKQNLFKCYAKRIAEDTKQAETNNGFRKKMSEIYINMLKVSENNTDVAVYQNFDMKKFVEMHAIEKAGLMGFAKAWSIISVTNQNSVMNFIRTYVNNRAIVSSLHEVVGLVNKAGGEVVMVTLACVTLAYDTIKAIYRWWNGEITGLRCCKIIVDSFNTTVASVAGGIGGACVGTLFGPVGTVFGGIAGGIVSASAAAVLSDRMTQWLFGVPKEEALENAFQYFHLDVKASNHEINTAYRKMCLKHHPDKGGDSKDFRYVQINMAIIKAAKGEF